MLAPKTEAGYQMLGELPAASQQDKVEVWSRTTETGESVLELVEYAWGSGLGWYVQKRITLDAGQVAALQALLGGGGSAPAFPRLRRSLASVQRHDNVIQLGFAE